MNQERAVIDADLVRRLVVGFDPFDYEQGKCYWCEGGWSDLLGPRGGKAKHVWTGAHKDDCPFSVAQAALSAEDNG